MLTGLIFFVLLQDWKPCFEPSHSKPLYLVIIYMYLIRMKQISNNTFCYIALTFNFLKEINIYQHFYICSCPILHFISLLYIFISPYGSQQYNSKLKQTEIK